MWSALLSLIGRPISLLCPLVCCGLWLLWWGWPELGKSDNWYDWGLADSSLILDQLRTFLKSLAAGGTSWFSAGTLPTRIAIFLSIPDIVRPSTVLYEISGTVLGGRFSCVEVSTVRIMAKTPVLVIGQLNVRWLIIERNAYTVPRPIKPNNRTFVLFLICSLCRKKKGYSARQKSVKPENARNK